MTRDDLVLDLGEVGGLVDNPFRLARQQFLALPQVDDVLLVHTWEGKPLSREHGGRSA